MTINLAWLFLLAIAVAAYLRYRHSQKAGEARLAELVKEIKAEGNFKSYVRETDRGK